MNKRPAVLVGCVMAGCQPSEGATEASQSHSDVSARPWRRLQSLNVPLVIAARPATLLKSYYVHMSLLNRSSMYALKCGSTSVADAALVHTAVIRLAETNGQATVRRPWLSIERQRLSIAELVVT